MYRNTFETVWNFRSSGFLVVNMFLNFNQPLFPVLLLFYLFLHLLLFVLSEAALISETDSEDQTIGTSCTAELIPVHRGQVRQDSAISLCERTPKQRGLVHLH